MKNSPCGKLLREPPQEHLAEEDLALALCANRFSFAMEVRREKGLLVARKTGVSST